MKTRHLFLALTLLAAPAARAQFNNFGDVPVEINVGEGGEQRFEGGVAIAQKDVVIHYGPTSIFADYAQYNPDTRDVLLIGNVRIYRDGHLFVGDRALYNLETKLLRAEDFRGNAFPFFFQAQSISSLAGDAFLAKDALLTTSDSSKPDFHFKAQTARIYPGSHVVLSNVAMCVGNTPIFWFPYVYQSLKGNQGFNFMPGYNGTWGAFILLRDGFPITDTVYGTARLDLRSSRGAAIGLDVTGNYGLDNKSWIHFRSYYAYDIDPSINTTAVTRLPVSPNRYRISLQDRTFLTEDIYASFDVNKLSDYIFLRDFYPGEYKDNPQPDNVVSLTKKDDDYTLTAITRAQINNFFDTTERLPEVELDIKRQPLFGSQVFFEGETGIARLSRTFGISEDPTNPTPFTDFNATRFDTFAQLSAPKTFGGWLSVIPRIGVRGTYYSNGAETELTTAAGSPAFLDLKQSANTLLQSDGSGAVYRGVFNAGVEASFKFSRTWEDAQTRAWGLDGLRHVVQPYTDLSFVRTNKDPEGILQFDRLNPSTQLPPIDFPQFTTLDSIPDWTIWRFGVRQRLETRRNDSTFEWVRIDSYFDLNIVKPQYPGFPSENTFSNVHNNISWTPVPWATFVLTSQLPLLNKGYDEVNTGVNLRVTDDLRVSLSHGYLSGNPFFDNTSNLRLGAYYRINDNWGISFSDQYEFQDNTMESQDYEIHRDLSSWIATLGLALRDNVNSSTGQNVTDVGVFLTFTLKDLPSLSVPVSFDPSSTLTGK